MILEKFSKNFVKSFLKICLSHRFQSTAYDMYEEWGSVMSHSLMWGP